MVSLLQPLFLCSGSVRVRKRVGVAHERKNSQLTLGNIGPFKESQKLQILKQLDFWNFINFLKK